jgi:hypothetical protein
MGRPLNKKYFGNRNIGTNGNQVDESAGGSSNSANYADDRIGGEGFANVTFGASVADTSYGSGAYVNKIPHITAIGAPSIPGGVQAVADVVTVKAVHAVVNQSGTPNGADYLTGDILTVTTGSPTTPAKFTVGALKVSGFTIVDRNDGNTAHGYAVDDELHFDNGVVLTVAIIGGGGYPEGLGNVQVLTLTNAGSYTGTTPPTGTVGQTNPNEVGGRGLTVNFSWGVKDVTVLQAGVYSSVAGSANTTSVTHADLSASTAAGCTLDIFYGVDTIQVTEKGSGYKGTETVTFTAADAGLSETRATGTMVLTTDSGAVGSATNQENAIVIYANIAGAGAVVGDIIRQVSTRRYKVRTAAGVGIVELESGDNTPNAGKAMIIATDSDSNTYYVTKLTAHRATLVRKTFVSLGQWQFESDQSAPWKFFEGQANADLGYVKIENA